jgi:enediyne biosynthesis protein E4
LAIATTLAVAQEAATKAHIAEVDPTVLVPAHFVDITARSGVKFLHQAPHTSRKYLIETMGSGVALFDCDNDGRLDIFLVNGAPYPDPTSKGFIPRKSGPESWNRLFHQKSDWTFEDITEKAGLKGIGYGMATKTCTLPVTAATVCTTIMAIALSPTLRTRPA